jgi:hypothetical protein
MQSEARIYTIRRCVAVIEPTLPIFLNLFHPHSGLRPFGVSLLYAGFDLHYQFQLYQSDPSGNYSGWKATCIGANNGTAQSLLKQDYKDGMNLEDATKLVIKVMSKTMDSTTLSSEKRAYTCPSTVFDVTLTILWSKYYSRVCYDDTESNNEPAGC